MTMKKQFLEVVAKLLYQEKTMILRPVVSGKRCCHVPFDEVDPPSGSAEENGHKWPQKGDFNRQMSFAIALLHANYENR